jgi:hypothetical protein
MCNMMTDFRTSGTILALAVGIRSTSTQWSAIQDREPKMKKAVSAQMEMRTVQGGFAPKALGRILTLKTGGGL